MEINNKYISSEAFQNFSSVYTYIYIYIYIWVFFHEHWRFTGQQAKGEGIFLTPHYHFHLLHRHLDIRRAITTESLRLHIASSQNRKLRVLLTLLRKKENALIIHSALE